MEWKQKQKLLKLLWNTLYHYIKTIETYCVTCKKYTANKNSSVKKAKQNRLMLLSNCAVCVKKKSTFVKNKEINGFSND